MPLKKMIINRNALLALAFTLLAASAYIWQEWLLPQEAMIAALKKERELESRRLSDIGSFARAYPDSKSYLNELDKKLAALEGMLPGDAYISDFLMEAEENLKEASVAALEVRTLPEVVKGGYKEFPLEMIIQGSFEEILEFHQKLQSSRRFVSVVSSTTSIKDVSQHDKSAPELESKLTLVIYSSFDSAAEKRKTK